MNIDRCTNYLGLTIKCPLLLLLHRQVVPTDVRPPASKSYWQVYSLPTLCKALAVGADIVMVTSVLLKRGVVHLQLLYREMVEYG